MTKVLYAAPDLPHLDSFSFELVACRFVHERFGVYPSSPAAPARRLGGRWFVAVATAPVEAAAAAAVEVTAAAASCGSASLR